MKKIELLPEKSFLKKDSFWWSVEALLVLVIVYSTKQSWPVPVPKSEGLKLEQTSQGIYDIEIEDEKVGSFVPEKRKVWPSLVRTSSIKAIGYVDEFGLCNIIESSDTGVGDFEIPGDYGIKFCYVTEKK